ncbi:MAG TPA: glycosyltransferase family 9 protein [Anaeromyxobacteraceae bacterium]|nr:glycosyltransferase family 9 protein [Anaeromyxobacteraceae bacterium]
MSRVERVLVVRYSALGDVVLATSVLEPLRESHPGVRVEWVTDAAYAPLLEGLPELSAVHRLDRRGLRPALELGRALAGRFDVAVDLQGKVKSALVARAAPRRIAFQRRAPGRAALAALGWDPPLGRAHATELYAEALRPLGVERPGRPRVSLSPAARARAEEALAGARGPAVALAPGARWATKRWPAARFARLAEALAADGASLVLAGGPGDAPALAAFRAACRAPVAADVSALPLDALAGALARVRLLVACDSGPVHLATAVGTPVLALFGPTPPARWGPRPPGRALQITISCAPCSNHGAERCPEGHHRCMLDLGVERVLAAAREMVAP